MSHWKPYSPSKDSPWNERRVLHLHRRTVFGATWKEVQRDVSSDPQSAVTRILDGTCRLSGVPTDFGNLANVIGSAAADSGSSERLKAWWIYRILFSPHPLEERLALMWHNHFATSNLKVNDLKLMLQQNNLLRRTALAPFGELLRAMCHDPALLLWLDAPSNKAGQTNENLARELMELFTLGVGHYSESDVKEVARALTGWTVNRGEFQMTEKLHDPGSKNLLSKTGNFNGDDVVAEPVKGFQFLLPIKEQSKCFTHSATKSPRSPKHSSLSTRSPNQARKPNRAAHWLDDCRSPKL